MACNSHNPCGQNSCNTCTMYLDAKCITVKNSYSCLGIHKNDSLEEALGELNQVVCNLNAETPTEYDVQGTDGEIVVTESLIGDVVTFTVGLDGDITNLLTELSDDVSIINSELNSKICGITTNTPEYLSITNPSGCTYNIDFTPSGFVSYDGIIENNYSQPESSGSTGTEVLVNYINNFTSSSQITTGDIITVTTTAELGVCSDPGQAFTLRFTSNSSTKHDIVFDSNIYPQSDVYNKVTIEMVMRINVKSATEAYVSSYIDVTVPGESGSLNIGLGDIGIASLRIYPVKSKTITGINWSNVQLQVISEDQCGVVNKVGEFFVDVRKKL